MLNNETQTRELEEFLKTPAGKALREAFDNAGPDRRLGELIGPTIGPKFLVGATWAWDQARRLIFETLPVWQDQQEQPEQEETLPGEW